MSITEFNTAMTETTNIPIKTEEVSIMSESSNSISFNQINITADVVKRKLMNNEYIIKSVAKRSDVWKTFGLVCNSNGDEVGYVACFKCKATFKGKGDTGTTTMRKHICRVGSNQTRIVTTTFRTTPLTSKASSNKDVKEELSTSCVNMCCEDLRPFDTVAGEGFIELLQKVC